MLAPEGPPKTQQINSEYHPKQEVEEPPGASSPARASPGPGPGEGFQQGKETETLQHTVIAHLRNASD